MTSASRYSNPELAAALELAREQAGKLSAEGRVPEEEVRALERVDGGLVETTRSEVDWRQLAIDLPQPPDLVDCLSRLCEQLTEGDLIAAMLGDESSDPQMLWRFILIPILRVCHMRQPDWEWDEGLTRESIADWYAAQESRAAGHMRTIAPLYAFDGPGEVIRIDDDLAIRPLTDSDREALWQTHFGEELEVEDLARWTHAIDFRWSRLTEDYFDFNHEPGIDRAEDLVRAMRLLHPGMVGVARVWTRADPPDDPDGMSQEAFMQTRGDASWNDVNVDEAKFLNAWYPEPTEIGPEEGAALAELLRKMRGARDDRILALALRRFDTAYSRFGDEDQLIDLWIAFEALMLLDGQSELSYRAALRIAQFAADNSEERREIFSQARDSYNCRSRVVHGKAAEDDLGEVVEQTRELARRVLRAWILEPPSEGVKGIDNDLLG